MRVDRGFVDDNCGNHRTAHGLTFQSRLAAIAAAYFYNRGRGDDAYYPDLYFFRVSNFQKITRQVSQLMQTKERPAIAAGHLQAFF